MEDSLNGEDSTLNNMESQCVDISKSIEITFDEKLIKVIRDDTGKIYDIISTQSIQVTDAIHSQGIILKNSLSQLQNSISSSISTVNNPSFVDVLYALLIAFIGAFSAYLFNFFHWKMVERRNNVSSISNTLSLLITDLESDSIKYWLVDAKEDTSVQENLIELSIKSKLRLISRYVKLFGEKCPNKPFKDYHTKLKDFVDVIYDLSTGDEFESINRKASKKVAQKISFLCTDIRALLMSFEVKR